METNSNSQASRSPLQGIRVLDFTIIMSGPMCTRTLADAGADVIKIEAPKGDTVRHRPPIRAGNSTYFGAMNCGKRSVVLDLSTPEGKEIALALAKEADVVVENFRPGVMKRLGLDYETLRKINPRLIYCAISGFGQSGPMALTPAYAPVIHAASGYELAHLSYQDSGDRPANNAIFIADVLGAVNAFGAINLALYDRERTGLGQFVDVALMDSVLGMLIWEVQAAQTTNLPRRQVYQPVHAKDGFVIVAAVTPKNVESLFDLIGFSEGKTDPRFSTPSAKERHWSELLELVETWTRQHTIAECEDLMSRSGVPCSGYKTVEQAMNSAQAIHRGVLSKVGNSEEEYSVINPPFRLSGASVSAQRHVPTLGEDTTRVLIEALGMNQADVQRLRERGIIG